MCAIKWAIYYYEALCFKERFDVTLGKKQNKKLKAKIKAVKRRVRKSKKVKSLKQKAFGLDQMLFKVLFWGLSYKKELTPKL